MPDGAATGVSKECNVVCHHFISDDMLKALYGPYLHSIQVLDTSRHMQCLAIRSGNRRDRPSEEDNKVPIVPHQRCSLTVTTTHFKNVGLPESIASEYRVSLLCKQ